MRMRTTTSFGARRGGTVAAAVGPRGTRGRRTSRQRTTSALAWGRAEREREGTEDEPQAEANHQGGRDAVENASVAEGVGGVGTGERDDVIEFRDVWKSFGQKAILRGTSFSIKRGEAVGIIGPSGTGKSTALRLISGLISPDSGEILVDGKRIGENEGDSRGGETSRAPGTRETNGNGSGKKTKRKTSIQLQLGLVFQNGALFDSLTVGENVGFRLYEHSSLRETEIREIVSENLAKVGLQGIEERYPSELSGGMRKRVALARAITNDGDGSGLKADGEVVEELIMYDEPTAGLDPVASTVVEDLIRSLKTKGGVNTYIVVTHQASTIARAVDRIIFLHEGMVAWQGNQEEFASTAEPIVRQFRSGSLSGPISYV